MHVGDAEVEPGVAIAAIGVVAGVGQTVVVVAVVVVVVGVDVLVVADEDQIENAAVQFELDADAVRMDAAVLSDAAAH